MRTSLSPSPGGTSCRQENGPHPAWPCALPCQVPALVRGTQNATLCSLGQKTDKAAREWNSRSTGDPKCPTKLQAPRLEPFRIPSLFGCLKLWLISQRSHKVPTWGSPVLHLLCDLPDSLTPGSGSTALKSFLWWRPQSSVLFLHLLALCIEPLY